MDVPLETGDQAMSDIRLLAYAQHMTLAAQSETARLLFAAYVEQERQRLEVLGRVGRLRAGKVSRADASSAVAARGA